eukprot:TRINITY_DN7636_c0_g1_i4.p1 TRINITY_DN7636_c0_g1~~TRINITY_DN7636_c0_g1_i4.p1  ORF type:complete len:195 (-),score=3.56 TRINITY_DN7636_c0_g1_i4:75-659(-)
MVVRVHAQSLLWVHQRPVNQHSPSTTLAIYPASKYSKVIAFNVSIVALIPSAHPLAVLSKAQPGHSPNNNSNFIACDCVPPEGVFVVHTTGRSVESLDEWIEVGLAGEYEITVVYVRCESLEATRLRNAHRPELKRLSDKAVSDRFDEVERTYLAARSADNWSGRVRFVIHENSEENAALLGADQDDLDVELHQ